MSQANFLSQYLPIRELEPNVDKLKRMNKDDMSEKLCIALKALQEAEQVIATQSDTIIATNSELLQQCADNRKLSEKKIECASYPVDKTYADATKKTINPLVIRTNEESASFNNQDFQKKVQNALKNVSVSSTRITKQGNMVINLPSESAKEKAEQNLSGVFDESVEIATIHKIPPKLTVVGLPSDFNPDEFRNAIIEKDEELKKKLEKNESFIEVLRCWDIKNDSGTVISKKLALRVSPDVRHQIINLNQGYIYMNLARYRTYDRLMVTQCFHCYGFNHIAKSCSEKSKVVTCGRCSAKHDTKNCRSPTEKCVNCARYAPDKSNDHCAYSFKCPLYENERNNLINRTNYEVKN